MGYTASYNLNGRTIYITDQPLAPFVFPGISLQLPKTLLVDLDNAELLNIAQLKRCAYHSQEQEKPLEKELAT